MTKLCNFYIDEKLHYELKMLAAREGRSITDILNELSLDYVKMHKEGNPQHLITSYLKNGQFIGFPNISIKTLDKKNYVKNMDKKMIKELYIHVCEWEGIVKRL